MFSRPSSDKRAAALVAGDKNIQTMSGGLSLGMQTLEIVCTKALGAFFLPTVCRVALPHLLAFDALQPDGEGHNGDCGNAGQTKGRKKDDDCTLSYMGSTAHTYCIFEYIYKYIYIYTHVYTYVYNAHAMSMPIYEEAPFFTRPLRTHSKMKTAPANLEHLSGFRALSRAEISFTWNASPVSKDATGEKERNQSQSNGERLF